MYYNFLHAADWITQNFKKYNHCYFILLIIQEKDTSTIRSGFEEDHKKVVILSKLN